MPSLTQVMGYIKGAYSSKNSNPTTAVLRLKEEVFTGNRSDTSSTCVLTYGKNNMVKYGKFHMTERILFQVL